MDAAQTWLLNFLEPSEPGLSARKTKMFQSLAADSSNIAGVNQILDLQKMLKDKWQLMNRIDEILHLPIPVPNGTVGKYYEAPIDFIKLNLGDIVYTEFKGLEAVGLGYDNDLEKISGSPTQSGDIKVTLLFRIQGEPEDSTLNEKKITLVINPDPKSLWKNIPSDPDGLFAKADNEAVFAALGTKNIVVASRRGRSHANVGSYRDDDYAL